MRFLPRTLKLRSRHGSNCWRLVFLVGCTVTGCTSSSPAPDGGQSPHAASSGGSLSAPIAEGAAPVPILAGTPAPEVYTRTWDPQKKLQVTTASPNELQVRVVAPDEIVVVPISGFVAFAKPGTKEVAYLAFTCGNTSCQAGAKPGRPLVFPQPYKNVKLNAEGEVDWTPISVFDGPGPASEGMPPCPLCHSNSRVKIFVFPEIEPRLERLNAELVQSRIVLRESRLNNTSFPSHLRPPVAIMQEISSLPQLFITRPVQPDGTNSLPVEP